jgi:hypothetical protein
VVILLASFPALVSTARPILILGRNLVSADRSTALRIQTRYCQVLCSEFPGLGGVLHDSIDEFLSLQEMKNVFVSVQASPSFLGRLS